MAEPLLAKVADDVDVGALVAILPELHQQTGDGALGFSLGSGDVLDADLAEPAGDFAAGRGTALGNGEDIEARPADEPYPARLVLGTCKLGMLHVAVRDNIEDDEIVVETAYQPDPVLWEPGFKTRRKSP